MATLGTSEGRKISSGEQGESFGDVNADEVAKASKFNPDVLRQALSQQEQGQIAREVEEQGGSKKNTALTEAEMLKVTEAKTPNEILNPQPQAGVSWLNRLFARKGAEEKINFDDLKVDDPDKMMRDLMAGANQDKPVDSPEKIQ